MNLQARFGNKFPPYLSVVIFRPYFTDNPTACWVLAPPTSRSQWSLGGRLGIAANLALMCSLAGVAVELPNLPTQSTTDPFSRHCDGIPPPGSVLADKTRLRLIE